MRSEQLFAFSDAAGIDINYQQAGDEFSIVMSGKVDALGAVKTLRDAGRLNGSPVLVSLFVYSDPDSKVEETPVEEGGSNGDASSDTN